MKYKIGSIVEAKVTGIQPYGAFVVLDDNSNGLIHISEISDGFVKEIGNYVQIGEKIKVKIIDIDQNGHARCSIKVLRGKNMRKEKKSYYKKKLRIKETPLGFSSLKTQLPLWIKEKMEEENND